MAGRRKPPENVPKPSQGQPVVLVPRRSTRSGISESGPTKEALVKPQPEKDKSRRKATVEEVTDSEDDSEPEPAVLKKVAFELPYKDVPALAEVTREPVFPRRPSEDGASTVKSTKTKAYTLKSILDEVASTKETLEGIMEMIVPVKFKHLVGGSPALQKGLKSQTTKTRRSNSKRELEGVLLAKELDKSESLLGKLQSRADGLPFLDSSESEEELGDDAIDLGDLPFDQYATILTQQVGDLPEGAVIMGDPVLQYLESLSPGEEPKQIYTAMTSAALRCIFPLINGICKVESISDGGSQIVSMSEEKASELKVEYDPRIQIHMQSAHGNVEKTLGLARNVPFEFGRITIYLQVHVIRKAPYQVLLGRPFEILTESVVKNCKDGSQTLTLTDPNSGARVTIPTRPRGFGKQAKAPESTDTETPSSEESQDF